MNYRLAKHAELFTTAEKDEAYCKTWIEDDVQEILQRCLGVRRWVQFRSAITVLSRIGYFAIDSIANTPTPGEEFCEMQPKSPSLAQRLMTTILNNDLQLPKEIPKPLVSLIKDVHMITFFFFGDFYRVSNRLTGVNYIVPNLDESMSTTKWETMNKLIGCLSILRLILNLPKQAELLSVEQEELVQNDYVQSGPSQSAAEVHPDIVCQLCSSRRNEPTSTLCGHVFCWYCIHNWLQEKTECPICRMPTEPSRLIHLVNFK